MPHDRRLSRRCSRTAGSGASASATPCSRGPTCCGAPSPATTAPRSSAYRVRDPERYGVVEFDGSGRALSLEEKPERPRSNYAVTGLYFYDPRAADLAVRLRPSPRGELEITDLNRLYLEDGSLHVECMGRGFAWLDTGTCDSLLHAATFVQTVEQRQGLKIACVEEVAFQMGLIGVAERRRLAQTLLKSGYGQYLERIVREHEAMNRAAASAA